MNNQLNQNRLELLTIEKIGITHEINELGFCCLTTRDITKVKYYSTRIVILERRLSELERRESLYSALSTKYDW